MYNTSLEALLGVLSDHAPAKVDALSKTKRDVEYGMLPVGLKIHDLSDHLEPLLSALGGQFNSDYNHYKHERANWCLVLPPVGSARAAVTLLECIHKAIGGKLFRNPEVQIQVCSAGKLNGLPTALLGSGRYLGSDYFPRYNIDDFATTFTTRPAHMDAKTFPESYGRGKRMVIHDAGGDFDAGFPFWDKYLYNRTPCIKQRLPFQERTDLLDCKTPLDVLNVNLLATLLVHREYRGYWETLGISLVNEMVELLNRHLLGEVLTAPWVCVEGSPIRENGIFMEALREIVGATFDDAARIARGGSTTQGILFEMNRLLTKYRTRLTEEARSVSRRENLS